MNQFNFVVSKFSSKFSKVKTSICSISNQQTLVQLKRQFGMSNETKHCRHFCVNLRYSWSSIKVPPKNYDDYNGADSVCWW